MRNETALVASDDLLALLDESAAVEEGEEIELDIPPVQDLIEGERAVARISICRNSIIRYKQVASVIAHRAKLLVEKEELKIDQAQKALQPFVKRVVDVNLKADPKAVKSVTFLAGRAGFKKSSGAIEIDDMGTVAKKCHEMGIPVKMEITKTALKAIRMVDEDRFKKTGAKFRKGIDSFYVTA